MSVRTDPELQLQVRLAVQEELARWKSERELSLEAEKEVDAVVNEVSAEVLDQRLEKKKKKKKKQKTDVKEKKSLVERLKNDNAPKKYRAPRPSAAVKRRWEQLREFVNSDDYGKPYEGLSIWDNLDTVGLTNAMDHLLLEEHKDGDIPRSDSPSDPIDLTDTDITYPGSRSASNDVTDTDIPRLGSRSNPIPFTDTDSDSSDFDISAFKAVGPGFKPRYIRLGVQDNLPPEDGKERVDFYEEIVSWGERDALEWLRRHYVTGEKRATPLPDGLLKKFYAHKWETLLRTQAKQVEVYGAYKRGALKDDKPKKKKKKK